MFIYSLTQHCGPPLRAPFRSPLHRFGAFQHVSAVGRGGSALGRGGFVLWDADLLWDVITELRTEVHSVQMCFSWDTTWTIPSCIYDMMVQ